jgi:hypothetical protein
MSISSDSPKVYAAMLDMHTGARRPFFQPGQDLSSTEAVLATEPPCRKAVTNDKLGHRPHVHFKHLRDMLGGEHFAPRILMIDSRAPHARQIGRSRECRQAT